MTESASELIDAKLAALDDWRGEVLSRMRRLIREADPDVEEAVKWRKPSNPPGVPVWEHAGIVCTGCSFNARCASPRASVAELLFGAVAIYSVACASVSSASGRPMKSQAWCAATASGRACGSASPTSSLARITSRRAMKRGASPPANIFASQYIAASGSLPRQLLMNAEIVS